VAIEPREFANKYLQPYKIKGDEIVPMYCPYCHGGESRDKYTAALNTEKLTFNCKRGSCGKTGTFYQLCEHYGEVKKYDYPIRPLKTYKPPQTKINDPTTQAEEYLKKRKISPETMKKRGVGCDDKGNITFPYYENGKLVLVKFRPARKVEKGERKGWREEGGKAVLWGMDLCSPEFPLVLTEGELDTMACDEAGVRNAVSVPSGAEDLTWIENCWEWLERFKKIILFGDSDGPGQEMIRKLIIKLGEYRCYIAKNEYKDANELLFYKGPEAVKSAVESAAEVPITGLLRLSEVKTFDINNVITSLSGIGAIDSALQGFMMGQVTIWTGNNASGKSTFLGQMMLESIDQGFAVCAYSGELPAPLFKYWIDLQAAGEKFIVNGKVDYDAKQKISRWYYDQFFLYDSYGSVKSTDILKVFEHAARRYDCKIFMIDNLMTTDFSELERDWYHGQSLFVGRVKEFAHKFDVHVHVVAHPRKVQGKLEKNDIAGSGDISNRADNVLAVSRLSPDNLKENSLLEGCQTVVSVLKSRFTGKQDIDIGLKFNPISKQFISPSRFPKQYRWDKEAELWTDSETK